MLIKKELLEQIQTIISQAKNKAVRSLNFERVLMYRKIGKLIFEEKQDKEDKMAYSSLIISVL